MALPQSRRAAVERLARLAKGTAQGGRAAAAAAGNSSRGGADSSRLLLAPTWETFAEEKLKTIRERRLAREEAAAREASTRPRTRRFNTTCENQLYNPAFSPQLAECPLGEGKEAASVSPMSIGETFARETVRLRVQERDTEKRHWVCYDVIKLVMALRSMFRHPREWRDPTFGSIFTAPQIAYIQRVYNGLSMCANPGRNGDASQQPVQLRVRVSRDGRVRMPRAIYASAVSEEGKIPRQLYRISHPTTFDYTIVSPDDISLEEDMIELPRSILSDLQLDEDVWLWFEPCHALPVVQELTLRALVPEWNSIPLADQFNVLAALSDLVQTKTAVVRGEILRLRFKERNYPLRIIDIRYEKTRPMGGGGGAASELVSTDAASTKSLRDIGERRVTLRIVEYPEKE